ncbi:MULTISPECIES: tetratricopeptide repeat protein [unclassified Kosmotoga]|uniref:tetratricopeptide repeat protein n=1 Tax=unclassified Kosmotoga TaxID=2631489 RepID=UPI0007C51C14|nr:MULTISPECIES: hypothetical protein [unclassified Kosmotoga]MDI3524202.1 hypothetical protein [Kosmotoga sp.]MDK2953794.1 hypothetical protein [Kosmotoga sp.]OAA23660.1 hypothetical protein DU53_02090 [Kosmotoga sp. DU53]
MRNLLLAFIVKKTVLSVVTLLLLLLAVTSCVKIDEALSSGFDYLRLGDYDNAISKFNKVLFFSSDKQKEALAYEGMGWAYYMKGFFGTSESNFFRSLEIIPSNSKAKAGLVLVNVRKGNWDEALGHGEFIVDETEFQIDYLPDPLGREELLKLLAIASIHAHDDAAYSTYTGMITDQDFLDRLEQLKGGE